MFPSRTVIVAAFALLIPIGAAAQGDKPATTPPTVPGTPTKAASDQRPGHWLASGFVGALGYLFRDRWGAEFDAGITPDFQLQNNVFGAGVTPRVNSYMANAIWAVPLGADRQLQPFASAGVGALSLRSGLVSNSTTNAFDADDSRFGANVGGGVMGFSGSWGFKADLRYFRATGAYDSTAPIAVYPAPLTTMPSTLTSTLTDTSANALANAALSGLHFWRANVGVAIRW